MAEVATLELIESGWKMKVHFEMTQCFIRLNLLIHQRHSFYK